MLQDDDWEIEIIDGLITKLRIPLPSAQTVLTKKDIFYPAHLIGMCAQQLVKFGFVVRMSIVMNNVMHSIQALTMVRFLI